MRAEVLAQHDVAFGPRIGQSVGETRTRTTETEDRLVGVGGDDRRFGSGADESDQFCCLRVEVLRVVDDQVPDATALPREKLGICRERRQCRPDELCGVDRGRRRTGSREPHGPAQQHVLLVLGIRASRRRPFRTVVRAPERGILTSIRTQAGQSVAAGATLLTILPSEGRLQATLYVESASIGFLETGAPVMLRYAAFPFQRFGLYRGTVVEVTRAPVDAADAPDASGLKDKAGAGIYRIVVRPEEDGVMAYGEKRRLEAGMRVEADIALEKRPLYRWLLDPLFRVKRSVDLVTGS